MDVVDLKFSCVSCYMCDSLVLKSHGVLTKFLERQVVFRGSTLKQLDVDSDAYDFRHNFRQFGNLAYENNYRRRAHLTLKERGIRK